MHHQSIGFIGGGRVTRIILEGWQRAQKLPATVVVSDCQAEALARIMARFPGVETAGCSADATGQDVVFLAVHPPVKPLAEMETQVTELYRTRLPGVYQKIQP